MGAKSPEQRTWDASKLLKSLSDEQWTEIAQGQLEQEYEILKGDTLWGISLRLFGDGNYWPKVWALNGQSIPNPHWILPGRRLIFKPGSATSLPAITLADASDAATSQSKIPRTSGRSQEWRSLTPQDWESVQLTLPPEVDSQGFDLKSGYQMPKTSGLDLHQIAQSIPLEVIAKVRASSSRLVNLTAGEIVILEPAEGAPLQAGQILTLTRAPRPLKSKNSDREGWVYSLDGRIQVLGQSGQTWTGKILNSSGFTNRGESVLVDLPVRRAQPSPIPAPEAFTAVLNFNLGQSTSYIAQHQLGFIDRGAEDGVSAGMVFRAYQYPDDIEPTADFLVLDVSERFSTVLTISSSELIAEGVSLKALTDVSSLLQKKQRTQELIDETPEPLLSPEPVPVPVPAPEASPAPETQKNELDPLEENPELSEEEKKNLKQLELKEEPEAPTAPAPSDELPTSQNPEESKEEPPQETSPEPTPEPTEESAPSAPPTEPPEAPPDF
jgi:hypothetical protein